MVLLAAFLVALFALQNAQVVPVRFLFWAADLPLALVLLGVAAAGALVGGMAGWVRQVGLGVRFGGVQREKERLAGDNRRLQEQVASLQAELAGMREAKANPGAGTEPA
jgi:uncharacterized integral membrane protein